MKAIKLLAIAVIVSAFASCGVLKNKSKSSQRSSIEEIVKRDCVFIDKSSSKGEVKELSIDKGTIVTERETTTTTEKGGKSKVGIKLKDLKHGDNFLRDSAGQQVKAVLDTLNKVLTVETEVPKERTTTVTKEKTTEKKDKQENKKGTEEKKVEKQAAIVTQDQRRESTDNKSSVSKPNPWAILTNNIGWAIGAVIVIIVLVWWFFGIGKKSKKT